MDRDRATIGNLPEGRLPNDDLLGQEDQEIGGRYRLGSMIRYGSDCATYSAVDEQSRIDVRIRISTDAPDPRLLRLSHPALPAVLDRGRIGQRHYLVLERPEGAPVAPPRLANAADPTRLRSWIGTAMELLDALEHAHTSGLVYGDIGLCGLWQGHDGRIRFADLPGAEAPPTVDQIPWASPERLRGLGGDVRGDLYALGCVLYALAHGSPPHGSDPADARDGHLHRPLAFPAPHRGAPFLSAPLCDILRTALDKQPQRRFASAARMRAAFQLALHEIEAQEAFLERISELHESSLVDSTEETTIRFSLWDDGEPNDGLFAPDPVEVEVVLEPPSEEVPIEEILEEWAPLERTRLEENLLNLPIGVVSEEVTIDAPAHQKLVPPEREPPRPQQRRGWGLAIAASLVGILASGVAWLAAVVVLAWLASRSAVTGDGRSTVTEAGVRSPPPMARPAVSGQVAPEP